MLCESQTTKQPNMLILCSNFLFFFLFYWFHQSVHLSVNFWHVKKKVNLSLKTETCL